MRLVRLSSAHFSNNNLSLIVCHLLLILVHLKCQANGLEWITDDSIIVEPENVENDYPAPPDHDEDSSREDRQFSLGFVNQQIYHHSPHYPIRWPPLTIPVTQAKVPETTGTAGSSTYGSCTTSRKESGYCTTLKQCFPALYTSVPDDNPYESNGPESASNSTTMMKDVIKNPVLADVLRSISGNCPSSSGMFVNQFYFKSDANLLRQNLICCSNGLLNEPSVVVAERDQPTPFKINSRPKIPIGFGGHRPPSAIKQPTPYPPQQAKETTTEGFLVQSSCGVPKIVGGNETYHGKYPWVVAILTGQKQICGGSLIDNKYVLTAAHCVAHMRPEDVARLRILLGAHNVKQVDSGTVVKKVTKVMRHRGFSHKTLHNDVAVLKLDSSVQFSNKISPICLDAESWKRHENSKAIVAGWGSVGEFAPQPDKLREVTIDIWTNAQCKLKYGHLAPGGIMDHMMCAGSSGQDACRGDSGGPLMQFDGRKYLQIGLVSWGIGCGRFPGVYSRIGDFRDWIDKQREL